MNELPLNKVICGDCVETMRSFPSESIDLVVTSPPYWGLRDYEIKGQIGLEEHPQKYIDNLTNICKEIKRVLKPSGSFWLNLGDTYCGSGGAGGDYNKGGLREGQPKYKQSRCWLDPKLPARQRSSESTGFKPKKTGWLQPKQLLGIPWRVATVLQNDGWILRNAIIWHKPNHMPSSVKDRLTNAYEFVFLLVKARRYYFDLDAIRKPHATGTIQEITKSSKWGKKKIKTSKPNIEDYREETHSYNLRGKNPGDVWRITTKPFPGAHFAVFPPNLIKPIIKAGCPEGGIVLDPFCGSGTVGKVARTLRRKFILIDIKSEYCEMAEQRIRGKYRPPIEGVIPLTEIHSSLSKANNSE